MVNLRGTKYAVVTVLTIVQIGLNNGTNVVFLNVFERVVDRCVVDDTKAMGHALGWAGECDYLVP